MRAQPLSISDVVLITPKCFEDPRGYFVETFKESWFRENVADLSFVQDNQSLSVTIGTIRGLHYQTKPFEQGKLVRCLKGAIFDVAVDIRPQSPHFGKWVSAELSEDNQLQLWVPPGFAHGFCTTAPDTIIAYKVTNSYSKAHDFGLAFDDKTLNINWPVDVSQAIVSDKDKAQPAFSSLKPE